MITFNDIMDSGCQFESDVCIIAISYDGEPDIVFEGDGTDIPNGMPWGEGEISHIYYDSTYEHITIEIEQEE